ncbi:MAG: hypothetical protein AB7Q00_01090 [Phycisphaerales bacterium]
MDPKHFLEAKQKVEHAVSHVDSLFSDVDAYRKQAPWVICQRVIEPERAAVIMARETQPCPTAISLKAGDVVHCGRCALDYMIYGMSRLDMADSKRKGLQFPICETQQAFETIKSKNRHMNGLVDSEVNLIEKAQPYHNPLGCKSDPLWWLQQLSNGDKHHSLRIAAVCAQLSSVQATGVLGTNIVEGSVIEWAAGTTPDFGDETAFEKTGNGVLGHEDTQIGTIRIGQRTRARFNLKFDVDVGFANDHPEVAGKSVMLTLKAILDRVWEVVHVLASSGNLTATT